jgi:CelD/BcsL family acetyltransferase involved in cellulose biosynthesis
VRVELTGDPAVFLARDWSDVVRADPGGTFFHTPAYLKLWWEEFGTGALMVAVVEDGGEVAGACCFEDVEGTLTFLGGFDVTDYMGPVALPGTDRDAMAKELMAAVAEAALIRADLRGLPAGSPWVSALASAASAAGLRVETGREDVAPFIALPDTFDRYLSALPPKLRHEIRRKERRLRQEAGHHRISMSTVDTIAGDMDRFIELHRSSAGPKGGFMRAGMEIFFRRLAETFLPPHVFHLAFLEIEGEKVAGAIGFGFGDTFSLYNSVFDRRFAPLAPGMVLVSELIRMAIESGRRTFDLLKGDLAYKYRFGAVPRPIRSLILRRPG